MNDLNVFANETITFFIGFVLLCFRSFIFVGTTRIILFVYKYFCK